MIESKKSHIQQKCGLNPGYEWSNWDQNFNRQGRKRSKQTRHRYARDIKSTVKYIETALFLDKKFVSIKFKFYNVFFK